jgi:predicted Zn-dependent peptidase
VVTGNVGDAHVERIRARFGKIRARPVPVRAPVPPPVTEVARVTVADLEEPFVALVLPVPADGSLEDGAIDIAGDLSWVLSSGEMAVANVIGEERARAIVVRAPAKTLDFARVEAELRKAVTKRPYIRFEYLQERSRLREIESLDDLLGAGHALAMLAARRQPVTRFHRLRHLRAAKSEQLKQWLDPARARVIHVLPAVGTRRGSDIDALATSLHDVEVLRPSAPAIDASIRPSLFSTIDYRLPNGLRVLLAPDPGSVSIDARVVVTGTPIAGARDQLPTQAAWRLEPRATDPDVMRALRWYRSIVGVPVIPTLGAATVFRVSGLALFGDWHVWNLGLHLVDGRYQLEPATQPDKRTPDAAAVVTRRLARATGDRVAKTRIDPEQLEQFRQENYRPERSTLIVAGKFDVKGMRAEIATVFGRWRSEGAAAPVVVPRRLPANYVAIPADDATVQLSLAFSITPSPHDASAREVMVEMLNDQLRQVREGLGASYGIFASIVPGGIRIDGDVEPAYANEAASAIATAISRVRTDVTLANELARARAAVYLRSLAQPLGARSRAAALERIAITGERTAALQEQITALQTLDLATVQRIATRDLHPQHVIAAVRGNDEKARVVLRALGATDRDIRTLR